MTLTEILNTFDKSTGKTFDEHEVASELKQLIPEDKSKLDD